MRSASLLTTRRYVSAVLAILLVAACATTPQQRGRTLTQEAAVGSLEGGRWGLSVKRLDGTPIANLNSEDRFVPASTLKLVTTISAMHYLGDFSSDKWPQGTSVYRLETEEADYPGLILEGTGDASLSAAPDCETNCLSALAVSVASQGLNDIGDIHVDDSLFHPPSRPDGWGHEDLAFGYGTAISALSVDGGTARGLLVPSPVPGEAPELLWETTPPFSLDVSAVRTEGEKTDLDLSKQPASLEAELSGTIATGSEPIELDFGIDDPALQAGLRFRQLLERQGVRVHGHVERLHSDADTEKAPPTLIDRLPNPDPRETLTKVLHESNNFHAETLLHHISLLMDDPTQAEGIDLVEQLLLESGAAEDEFNIADGSGVSFYNRLSPDTLTDLLVWASHQDWYEHFLPLLAHGGVEGTLENRLNTPLLKQRVQAKTGTVFGADALAGYFTGQSGERYAFTLFINDSALTHSEARARIDALLTAFVEAL